jgi:enoyl-CoA hydratase
VSIDYVRQGHIVTITINRPETRNSLDMAHFRDLAHAWAAFRDDADAWVAVVTGVGRDFCTGADLKKFIPELTGELPQPPGWNKTDAIHAVLHQFPI